MSGNLDNGSIQKTLEARPPNWLPMIVCSFEKPKTESLIDENDNFSKGEIVSYYHHQRIGSLKSRQGEFLSFSMADIDLIGKNGPEKLEIGSWVGFDASHTERGRKIIKMKIY